MENFLKIEEGVSPTELRNPSNRTYLGTYKRWMVGSVIALCFIFPAVALLRSQATPERNADNNAGTSQFIAARPLGLGQPRASPLHAYVPSGMSKEEYAKLKKKEADAKKNKNFGAGGARGFESRSFASFQAARERGEADHLFPVDPKKVASGEIPLKDVPYMQRGGSWKNSDLTGKKGWMQTGFGMTAFNDGKAQKAKENKYDKMYNNVKPNIGIFDGVALDWTGKGERGGKDTIGARAAKNGISNDQQMWRDAGALTEKQALKRAKNAPKINFDKNKEKAGGFTFPWR
jgi:hypothetical protein